MQGGKAQIIADRQAQRTPRQISENGARARLIVDAFAVDLAIAEIDIEHMDLVVSRRNAPVRRDEVRAIG